LASFAHGTYLRITVVVVVAELLLVFGSLVLLDTVAVFVMIVPSFTPDLTWTTIVKVADSPVARLDLTHVMVPVAVPLVRGLVQLQSAVPEFETNFVLVGTASLRLALAALDGPLLVSITV
jgi:hypothetical protein